MRVPSPHLHGFGKASLFGIASVAVHGAVALAFPNPPVVRDTTAHAALVWMVAGGGEASGLPGGAAAVSSSTDAPMPSAAPARAKRKAVRASLPPPSEEELVHPEESAPPMGLADEPAQASNAAQEGAALGLAANAGAAGEGSSAAASAGSASLGHGGLGHGEPGAAGAGLMRGPGLIAYGSPCRQYFPAQARADVGEVQIEVTVDEGGHARASNVLAEMPKGHGFGRAASACADHLRFNPALNRDGARVAGRAKLLLRFRRT